MATDPNFPNQAYPPQKQGGSGLLWGLGIGCGVVLLLCCGGGVAFYMYFQSAISDDPTKVAAVAREIAQVDLPPGLEPRRSVSMKIMDRGMTIAIFQSDDGASMAVLMEIAADGLDPEDMKRQAEQQGEQQGARKRDLVDVESREIEFDVRGQPAKFLIEKGKDSQSNVEYVRGSGAFKTESGVAVLIVQGPAAQYTEEQIETSIRSIK